ncbi:MAG: Histidine-specific methyltransferase EgtD [Cenarchaeum symbiont of Oopsacas minuta]|nr:Histidine-specific methyltransferase EgtD [Cenarchaeum symbiont of Oopsacas minuta]
MTSDAKTLILEYERHIINQRLECLKRRSIESEKVFAHEVAKGLTALPKYLYPKFFYDDAGSELFEQICDLDEYYIARTESKLLHMHTDDLATHLGDVMRLVELGSGASIKTQMILDAMDASRRYIEYMPVDISEVIGENCLPLLDTYENMTVKGIVDTYEGGLELIKNIKHVPTLFAFLGSSLGNMNPSEALAFLQKVRSCMHKGDMFLVGLDLVKDARILHAAYDDTIGVTARFNKNILERINQELGADFDLKQFEHHVVYDKKNMCINMYLKSIQKQVVSIPKSNICPVFEKGELVHTENSFKYTSNAIKHMLSQAGMRVENMWHDKDDLFSLTLAT